MNTIIQSIASFFNEISSNSEDIDIDELFREKIDSYVSGEAGYNEYNTQRVIKKIRQQLSVEFPEAQNYLYCLQGQSLSWHRPERKSKEGLISGGFYVNGMLDLFLYPIDFWKGAVQEFSDNGCEHLADIPENIRWFESTTAHNDPVYTPQYGGVLIEPPFFPDKFFFYDSGFLYPLLFSTFEEYFSAMIDCASVRCWQYFYIEPEDIIKKNKGISYITWSLHITSHLDKKMRSMFLDESVKYDRLDLINEYLERCVRLLPDSFPFIDFSYHQKYYRKFKALYEKQNNAP